MTYTKKEREYYYQYRASVCEKLNITVNQYNCLRRLGEQLRKVYENDCNGLYKTEEEAEQAERDLIYRINVYKQECTELLYAHFQTDPRGASLYLSLEPILRDRYTDASCIY